MHVVVIVLGDIGRSPRMQYHSASLAKLSQVNDVTVIGYGGEKLIADLNENPKVHVQAINMADPRLNVRSAILRALVKGFYLLFCLGYFLFYYLRAYDAILIQNPPSLPAVFVAFTASIFNGAHIIIDWHNLGYSIYEHTLKSKTHPLVIITKLIEHNICSLAHHHVCVSKSLQRYLKDHANIEATVLYDRPPKLFQHSVDENHDDLGRLPFLKSLGIDNFSPTFLEQRKAPALLVSGTSWTPDEDFSLLLEALVSLEAFLSSSKHMESNSNKFDSLICVVTGKGELKAHYEQRVRELENQKKLGLFVVIRTAWLAIEDYPRLLASADLGVSLHSSTSGLDLPMKVLDMFGCGLPVLALDFPTLHELVQTDVNGDIFTNAHTLTEQLKYLLFATKQGTESMKRWRENLEKLEHWEDNWTQHMLPIVLSTSDR